MQEYKDKLEAIIANEDDRAIRESLTYYIGFIDGLMSVDCEPDSSFIANIESLIESSDLGDYSD